MKPRKPDRFERLLDGEKFVMKKEVIKLLRNEHAWMRRMVNKVNVWACQDSVDNEDVIVEILKQLAQRRK